MCYPFGLGLCHVALTIKTDWGKRPSLLNICRSTHFAVKSLNFELIFSFLLTVFHKIEAMVLLFKISVLSCNELFCCLVDNNNSTINIQRVVIFQRSQQHVFQVLLFCRSWLPLFVLLQSIWCLQKRPLLFYV
jgi:hypothetical protein